MISSKRKIAIEQKCYQELIERSEMVMLTILKKSKDTY